MMELFALHGNVYCIVSHFIVSLCHDAVQCIAEEIYALTGMPVNFKCCGGDYVLGQVKSISQRVCLYI